MNAELKTIRKEMTAGDLKKIIDLPNYDDNQRVKITVTPAADIAEKKILSEEEINALLDSLTGCLKGLDKSKTLADWRMERLAEKHGTKFAD